MWQFIWWFGEKLVKTDFIFHHEYYQNSSYSRVCQLSFEISLLRQNTLWLYVKVMKKRKEFKIGWMIMKQKTPTLLYGQSELCDKLKGAKKYMKDHHAARITLYNENDRTQNISLNMRKFDWSITSVWCFIVQGEHYKSICLLLQLGSILWAKMDGKLSRITGHFVIWK